MRGTARAARRGGGCERGAEGQVKTQDGQHGDAVRMGETVWEAQWGAAARGGHGQALMRDSRRGARRECGARRGRGRDGATARWAAFSVGARPGGWGGCGRAGSGLPCGLPSGGGGRGRRLGERLEGRDSNSRLLRIDGMARLQLCDWWQEHRRSSDHGVCACLPILMSCSRRRLSLPLHLPSSPPLPPKHPPPPPPHPRSSAPPLLPPHTPHPPLSPAQGQSWGGERLRSSP